MICLGCQRPLPYFKTLCFSCKKQIYHLSTNAKSSDLLTTLFSCQEPLRSLVISAKVERSWVASLHIKKIFLHSHEAKKLSQWADYITPAPSSLWSRAHLKYDLAYILAHHLAKKSSSKLHPPPWNSGWNIKKQSKKKTRRLVPTNEIITDNNQSGRKILLVDDVTTSGNTIQKLARYFPNDDVRALCLCSAQ